MQQARPEPMWMIVSIVERGRGRPLVEFYTARQMAAHLLCLGQGTASSEMLNLLGLGASEKDVLLSIGSQDSVQRTMQAMSNRNLGCPVRGRGVVFSVRLTGINALLAAAATLARTGAEPDARNPKQRKRGNAHDAAKFTFTQLDSDFGEPGIYRRGDGYRAPGRRYGPGRLSGRDGPGHSRSNNFTASPSSWKKK